MPCSARCVGGSDAAEHQQLRRVDGAAAEDDLAAGDGVPADCRRSRRTPRSRAGRRLASPVAARTGRTCTLPHERARSRPGGSAGGCRAQVRVGGGCPAAAALRHHRLREALTLGQVRGRHRVPGLAHGLEERRRLRAAGRAGARRTAAPSVPCVGSAGVLRCARRGGSTARATFHDHRSPAALAHSS